MNDYTKYETVVRNTHNSGKEDPELIDIDDDFDQKEDGEFDNRGLEDDFDMPFGDDQRKTVTRGRSDIQNEAEFVDLMKAEQTVDTLKHQAEATG